MRRSSSSFGGAEDRSTTCSTRVTHPLPRARSELLRRADGQSSPRSPIRCTASAAPSICSPGTRPSRTLLVIELKTELTSIEETLRRARFEGPPGAAGSRANASAGMPAVVARLLVLPEDSDRAPSDRGASRDLSSRVPARERSGEAVVVRPAQARWLASSFCQIRTLLVFGGAFGRDRASAALRGSGQRICVTTSPTRRVRIWRGSAAADPRTSTIRRRNCHGTCERTDARLDRDAPDRRH